LSGADLPAFWSARKGLPTQHHAADDCPSPFNIDVDKHQINLV